MSEDIIELVKNNLRPYHRVKLVTRGYIRENGLLFSGYVLSIIGNNNLLFISDIKYESFHSAYSIFSSCKFEDRCFWIEHSDIIPMCEGMLV